MDRLELRTRFAGKIETFHLDEFGIDVYLRGLSALARAKLGDKFLFLEKTQTENAAETAVIEVQARVVAQGLVDESGKRIYTDDEYAAAAEEIPAVALDKIAREIMRISGLGRDKSIEDAIKNSNPTPSDGLPSDSPKPSEGGM